MPSDFWLDGSESWWCHGSDSCHSHDASSSESCSTHDISGLLSVKSRDCLVSESSLIVSEHTLYPNSCLVKSGHVVRCQRCLNAVGRAIGTGKNTLLGAKSMIVFPLLSTCTFRSNHSCVTYCHPLFVSDDSRTITAIVFLIFSIFRRN